MKKHALLIGNSDGIGLSATQMLLRRGWRVIGVSRSASPINDDAYSHFVLMVQDTEYPVRLKSILEKGDPIDLCIFCAGIGEILDPSDMAGEAETIAVNLLGMVRTAAVVIPVMVAHGQGHFIGLSSLADEMLSPEAPSYHASKAGFSNYLEGLALSLRSRGVYVTNVRFGFVDTKMAKGDVRPFMMDVDRAVKHLLRCIARKPVRYSAPMVILPLIKVRRWILRWQVFFHSFRLGIKRNASP